MKPAENAAWQALDQGLGRGRLLLFYMSIPMVIGLEAYGRFAFVQAAMLIVAQPVMLLSSFRRVGPLHVAGLLLESFAERPLYGLIRPFSVAEPRM